MPHVTDNLKIDLERLITKHADAVKAANNILYSEQRGHAVKFANDRALNELVELLETHHQYQQRQNSEPFPGQLAPDCGGMQ